MITANIHEVKTHLSKLLERVALGEEVLIARAGLPVAKIVPLKKTARKPGYWKDKVKFSDDSFAELPQELLDEFYKEQL